MGRRVAVFLLVFGAAACGGAPEARTAAPDVPLPASREATRTSAPAPAAAAPAEPQFTLGPLAWDYLFDGTDGWYDASQDRSYGAAIASEGDGTARLAEIGPETWGKTTIVVKGIDFSRGPVLTVVVANVEEGAGWKAGVTTNPWSDAAFREVIPTGNGAGVARGEMAAATGWTGVKDEILLVLVVEGDGKSVVFDSLHINYTR